ncbi:MAG: recombination mediator RecR [Pseudomonadota bacterium]
MAFSPLLDELIQALRLLPGVGNKSAQRMAFFLLQRNRTGALKLAETMSQAMKSVGHCQFCRTFSESDYCKLCVSDKRDKQVLCVVESPADVLAIEQTASYNGRYFVLMGHLSPLDGIGPQDLGLDRLKHIAADENEPIKEIIVATNPTVEGEATAHYISSMLQDFPIKITRIAHGVPLGSELEYVDGGTLAHAFSGREEI